MWDPFSRFVAHRRVTPVAMRLANVLDKTLLTTVLSTRNRELAFSKSVSGDQVVNSFQCLWLDLSNR